MYSIITLPSVWQSLKLSIAITPRVLLKGKIVNEDKWHEAWVEILVAKGVSTRDAHNAFFVFYGNREIDLNKDPVLDALVLVPTAIRRQREPNDARTNISSKRFDGLGAITTMT